ncbi:Reverse transcriptase domain [Trinorchestia longiramus]|nr:Reverse transcriptase domain [Trinorchestia longiramus]
MAAAGFEPGVFPFTSEFAHQSTTLVLALIIPIPKPFKPLTAVESFHPISLLSCLLKLMERMIAQRLTFYLEQNGAFRNSQGGFRQRLAALDQVARLEAAIRSAITRREILLCLFVDLTDAFNTVWPTGVLYKLGSCGVRGPILRWLHSYLTNRSFQVYFEGSYSSMRGSRSGVPQGGILSSMLFNLMMSDIPIQTGVQLCEYADDLTFFTAHKDLHVATNKLQTQMDSLNKWSQEWGLKINCTKTKTMCFTNKRITPLPIYLDRQPLTFQQKYKYLGVILDAPHLRREPQINYLKQTYIQILNILQSISHRHWGADRHRGVSGIEAADSAAKAAYLLRYRTLTPYSKEETVSLACKAFRTRDSTWLQQVRVTRKGRHLVQIRDTSGSWPWASHRNRRVETALARLRVGHTDWNKGNIVNKGKINLPSDLGLHRLVFEAPNKHDKEEEEDLALYDNDEVGDLPRWGCEGGDVPER